MADGTTRSISAIKIGDEVVGENGEVNKVVAIETPLLGARKLYAFNDGPAFVTLEHPFMTRAAWKSRAPEATLAETGNFSVGALKVGDEVVRLAAVATRAKPMTVTFGGRRPEPFIEVLVQTELSALDSITPHDGDPSMMVYNLRLDGNHSISRTTISYTTNRVSAFNSVSAALAYRFMNTRPAACLRKGPPRRPCGAGRV